MPAGFSRSLLPNMEDFLVSVLAPLQEQIRSVMPNYSAAAGEALAPMNEWIREQLASIVASVPSFSMPPLELSTLRVAVLDPPTQEMLMQILEPQAKAMEGLRRSLGPFFDPDALRGFNRALLPPDLKDYAGEIRAS